MTGPDKPRTDLLAALVAMLGLCLASNSVAEEEDRYVLDGLERLLKPGFDSFDEMVAKRRIRVVVTYNHTHFFLDQGRARGIVADALHEWERALNQELKLGSPRLDLVAIPVSRDELLSHLEEGRADIAAGGITITPDRSARVDFSMATTRPLSELIIGGPDSPRLSRVEDLSGQTVMVSPGSSYHQHLVALNDRLHGLELPPVEILLAPDSLETEDLLEMVNAGLIPFTVSDDYLANFWAQVLDGLVVNQDLALATEQRLGWAVRKNADGLLEQLNRFVRDNRQGTLLGNMLINRYLKSTRFIDNAAERSDRSRFERLVGVFRQYASQYDFDHLLVAAQGYQESGLDQSARSAAGAVGIMQLLPSTAADKSVGIPDISSEENNIHAGVRYLSHLRERYFNDPAIDPLNAMLFSFAGYNAGPNRIRRLRNKAAELGYDPNRWFGQVELVVAHEVGQEPVRYVRNILKYYTAYRLIEAEAEKRRSASSTNGL